MERRTPRPPGSVAIAAGLCLSLLAVAPLSNGSASRTPLPSEEFFIVSSVDGAKGAMVVKRPTEVTLTMWFTEKTRCRSEQGTLIRPTDLRAGDTVFIASKRDASGQLVATSIRQGIMTLPELRRRYLRF
jgi:hypothetical protein